jgi:hypothetical protein
MRNESDPMTIKTISYDIAQGSRLSSNYSELVITSTGSIEGTGVHVNGFPATILNAGKVDAGSGYYGISMSAGGEVINRNTGTISGALAIYISNGLGVLKNYGVVSSGELAIELRNGGSVTNGSNAVRSAEIRGLVDIVFAPGTVTNFATITGLTSLDSGGVITNGSAADDAARLGGISAFGATEITNFGHVDGDIAVSGDGSVTNFGAITGNVEIIYNGGSQPAGTVRNGSGNDLTATCSAYVTAASITNFGTLSGEVVAATLMLNGTRTDKDASCGAIQMGGVSPLRLTNFGYVGYASLTGGGNVTNGSVADTGATIDGVFWNIGVAGATSLNNFGTINGVTLEGGGRITNGSLTDLSALIVGRAGLSANGSVADGSAMVMNWGTIAGTGEGRYGALVAGGTITNGSLNDKTALIADTAEYADGVYIFGAVGHNFGTIAGGASGAGEAGAAGAYVYGGESPDFRAAYLTNGVAADATAVIEGRTGAILNNEATLTNFGTIAGIGGVSVRVSGANGRLIAESGSTFIGTVIGGGGALELASGTGTISGLGATGRLSGAEAMTFSGFGTYMIDRGAAWGLTGRDVLEAASTLGIDGSLSSAGALTASGTITGAGSFEVAGGALVISEGAVVNVSHWVLAGGSTEIEKSLVFRNSFSESAGATVTLEASDKLTLAGSAQLDGAVNGPGTMSLADATVDGLTVGDMAIVAVSGTVDQTGDVTLGGGRAATLQIFKTGMWNLASGDVVDGAGGGSIKDYGLLMKDNGTALSTVGVPVFDDGAVEVATGTLDFGGKLFGTGVLKIDSGAGLEADGSAIKTLTVDFDGNDATLAMKFAKTFAATISGFAASDTLELLRAKATGANVNGSDQLVIVNGSTTVATLQLAGSYAGVSFSVVSNGNGGTDITIANGANEAPSNIQVPSPQLMVMAMAAMAPPPGVSLPVHVPAAVHSWMLTRPGTQLA